MERMGNWLTKFPEISPNVVTFNAALRSFGKALRWQLALPCLELMGSASLEANVISYTALLSSTVDSGRMESRMASQVPPWWLAMDLLNRMISEEVSPNILTYNAALVSCEKASQWQRALLLFFELDQSAPQDLGAGGLIHMEGSRILGPDVLSFSTAIGSCIMGSQCPLALFASLSRKALSTMKIDAMGVALCNGLRCYAFHLARLGFVGSLRQKAFQCYLSKDMSFYDKVDAAELSSRLTSDCQLVFASLDDVLNFLLRSGTVTFFGYLAMLRCCWQLTLVTTFVIALLLLLTRCYAEVRRATTAETQDAVAELSRVAEESLLGIGTVRALGAEETHEKLFHEQNQRILAVQKRNSYALGGFCLGNASLSGICRALGLASGGALALSQRISGEVLTQFLFYLDMVLRGVLDLGEDWPATMEALGAGSHVLETLAEAQAAQALKTGTRQLPHVTGDVHFDHVTFSYPMRPSRQVLKDVTIHCRAGEMTALVGTSGSGKSSLINLIQGFYSVQSGQVKIDGVSLEDFDPSWLREQLGIVGQEPHFFRGTVAENISWGSKASLEEVKEAAKISQAHDFIQQLPKGYDTQIGDGKLLSGGQRQRLAIARALLRDPPVLILDEPTSALDPSTSRLVSRALREAQWSPRLARRRTVLVIAHRLSTVKVWDGVCLWLLVTPWKDRTPKHRHWNRYAQGHRAEMA
eukprot:s1339_g15.t2